jgi:hypothetical protein
LLDQKVVVLVEVLIGITLLALLGMLEQTVVELLDIPMVQAREDVWVAQLHKQLQVF